jgi:hypothetical protein
MAHETGCAKDSLTEVGKSNLSNRDLPLPSIRYTFTTESSRNDLMTETYSWACTVFKMSGEFDGVGHTDNLNVWSIHGDITHPRYELVYPLNVLIRRRS